MKKNFSLLVWMGVLLLGACEKENGTVSALPESAPGQITLKIGYAEACGIAQAGIRMLESSSKTRAVSGRRAIDPDRVRYVVEPATRAGEPADTLMYVFNFEGDAGFALVAMDRRSDQLLAVTEQGSYTPGEPTGNPGFELYMDCAENYLASIGTGGGIGGGPVTEISKWVTYETPTVVGPYVQVKWGQDNPYNLYCYKDGQQRAAGCVATAIAQIMSYYSYPTAISLSYDGADTSFQTLNWEEIKKHIGSYYGGCLIGCTEHRAIGRLFREIGEQVNMEYGIYGGNESGAYDKNVPSCFAQFGYTTRELRPYLWGYVYPSLDNRQLVYMSGERTNEKGLVSGHAWVADGYMAITRTVEVWVAPSSDGPWRLDSTRNQYANYVHCNWGWDNDCDGYYSDNVFNTAKPHELDPGSSHVTNNRDYNLNLRVISNVRPQ